MPNQLTQQMENLYKASSERWEVGDRRQFLQSMSDPVKQKTLYDSLSVDFDLGTFEEYSTIVNQSMLELPTEHRDPAQPIEQQKEVDPIREILTPETAKIYDTIKQQVTPDETVPSIEAATPLTEQPIERGVQKEEPIKPYQIDPQADFGLQVKEASKETLRRVIANVRLETFTDIPEALSKALPEYGENLQKESNDAFIDAWEPLLEALDPKREEPLGKRLGKEGALFAIMAPVIATSMLDDPVKTTKGIAEFFLSIINDWIVATRLTTHPAYDAKESEEARAEIQRTPLFHTVPLLGLGAAFKAKIGKMKPEAAKTLSESLAKDVVKEAQKDLGKPFKEFPEDVSVTGKRRATEAIEKAEAERLKTIPEESKVTPKEPIVEPTKQTEIDLTRKINEGLKDAELAIKPKPIVTEPTKKEEIEEVSAKAEEIVEPIVQPVKGEEAVKPKIEKPIEIAEKPTIVPKKEETPVEPKVEGKKGEPSQVITVAEIEKSRIKAGLSKLPKEEAQKWADVLKGAEKRTDAVAIAESVRKKPRVLTNEEVLTLGLEKERIENLIDSSQKEISRAIDSGNKVEKSRHTDVQSNALVELDKITEAIRFHSRKAGQALQFHRIALEKEGELYKVASILQRAKVAKGERLTEIESNTLGKLGRKIEAMSKKEAKLTKEIEALQEILSKRDAKAEFARTAKRIPRKRTQTSLKRERADLFNDLNKIGYRLNDVIGLTYESAAIVGKLAKNYFESGIKDLDAIVEKIQTKVPDLSKKDVYDSIGGRIKKTKRIVEKTAKQELADLRKEAKLMGQIEDAYKGVFDDIKKRKLAPKKIVDLQKQLNALKDNANKTVKDDAKLNDILLRIDNAKALLASGQRAERVKPKPKTVDPSIARAKQELSELRRLLTTKDKITDLEHQLRTGDFKVPVKTRTVIKNADLIDTQVELTQLRREVRERIHAMTPLTIGQKAMEWVTLPRTLMSMADVSMIARQGLPLSARHPIQTVKFLPSSIQSFFSQNKADQIDVWIRKHPNQPTREQAGLFLSAIDKPLNTREEFFSSSLAERIPVYGKLAKASNRHAVTHLNFMRVAAFDQFLKNYPNATNLELKTWARLVNIMSGRGDLGAFNSVANELSIVMFSPRFSVSRVQLPFEVLRPSNLKHPSVRKEMAKSIASYLGLVGTVLFMADMAGLDVGTDPTSPDWLKIKQGDTRTDIFGGHLQSTRVLALAGLTALQTRGFDFEGDRDFRSAVERFERYKQSPPVTMTFEFITGKTSVGEETTPLGTIRRAITPFAFQDIVDTFKSEPKLLPIIAPLALSGVGINTYRERFGIKRIKL